MQPTIGDSVVAPLLPGMPGSGTGTGTATYRTAATATATATAATHPRTALAPSLAAERSKLQLRRWKLNAWWFGLTCAACVADATWESVRDGAAFMQWRHTTAFMVMVAALWMAQYVVAATGLDPCDRVATVMLALAPVSARAVVVSSGLITTGASERDSLATSAAWALCGGVQLALGFVTRDVTVTHLRSVVRASRVEAAAAAMRWSAAALAVFLMFATTHPLQAIMTAVFAL